MNDIQRQTARAQELLSMNIPAHDAPVQGLSRSADSATEDEFKKAAHKLGQFLKSKGIELSHGVALEALSASLGEKNWRAFRAKLAKAEKSVPKPVEGPRYLVNAIYTDNDQLYSDHVNADSPLAAAIKVQLERLSDGGWITEVSVTEVVDRHSKDVLLSGEYLGDLTITSLSEAIRKVCALARKALGEPPKRGIAEAEEWDGKNVAIAFWEEAVAEGEELALQQCNDILNDPSFDTNYGPFNESPCVTYVNDHGEDVSVNPADALKTVLDLAAGQIEGASVNNAKENGLFAYVQVLESLEMYPERFARFLDGGIVGETE